MTMPLPADQKSTDHWRVAGLLGLAGLAGSAACGAAREPTAHPVELEHRTPERAVSVASASAAERRPDADVPDATAEISGSDADYIDWKARFLSLVRDGGVRESVRREFEQWCGALLKKDPAKLPHWPDWGEPASFPGFDREPI